MINSIIGRQLFEIEYVFMLSICHPEKNALRNPNRDTSGQSSPLCEHQYLTYAVSYQTRGFYLTVM